jgi:hypothetical protein
MFVCLIVPECSQILETFGEDDRAFDCSEVAHCGASVAEGEVDAMAAVCCQFSRSENLVESFLRSVCVVWSWFILLLHFSCSFQPQLLPRSVCGSQSAVRVPVHVDLTG